MKKITAKDRPELIARIKVFEGYRRNIYKCSADKRTIGYGLNLDAGVSRELAAVIMEWQMDNQVLPECRKFDFWDNLTYIRQAVIAGLIFNMGAAKIRKFKKMLRALKDGDYERAAVELLDSHYARQVGTRAFRNAYALRYSKFHAKDPAANK